MIGPGIDHERGIAQSVGVLPRLPMRGARGNDVVAGEDLRRRVLQGQVREGAQVRLVVDERLSGVRMRRDGADLHVG